MRKKLTSVLVAIAMVFTMSGGYSVAYAAPNGSGSSNNSNINYEHFANEKNKGEYAKGQALVLLKPGKKIENFPGKKAKSLINLGDQVQIKNVWQFDDTKESKSARTALETRNKKISNPAKVSGDLNVVLVKSNKYSTEKLISLLEKNPNVEKAEPNRVIHAYSNNDSYYNYQWGLENKGQNGGTEGIATNPQSKWKQPTTSKETVVAVIDSGVDYNHPDLKNKMWKNTFYPELKGKYGFDFANYDDDPMDDVGHGTHCAGIIAGDSDNQIGIKGINPSTKIMALKFIGDDGSGYTSGAIGAFNYIDRAMELGVDIASINNSWGGGGYDYILDTIVTRIGEKGAISCFASGNDYYDLDQDTSFFSVSVDNPYIIIVNALDENNQLAGFSNYGKTTTHIGAPGVNILSSVSYNIYNPTIYSETKQKQVSEYYNNYENGKTAGEFGVPAAGTLYSDIADSKATFKAEITNKDFFGEKGGHGLKLTFDNLAMGEFVKVTIPYTSPEVKDTSKAPIVSVMTKTENTAPANELSPFGILDVVKGQGPKNQVEFDNMIEEGKGDYNYISGKENYWNHLSFSSMEEEPKGDNAVGSKSSNSQQKKHQRELDICVVGLTPGQHTIYIDDLAISKPDIDPNEFEKYEFYNGTSMATPFVTGAVALLDEESRNLIVDEKDKATQGLSKINYLLQHANKDKNLESNCVYGASLDLSKKVDNGPSITKINTNFKDKTISFKGFGLDNKDLVVKVNGTEAQIKNQSANQLTIADNNWLNNVVTIEFIAGDKKLVKKDVYLVHSKAGYKKIDAFEFPSDDVYTTDGRNIYSASSDTKDISKVNTKTGVAETIGSIPMEEYFANEKSKSDIRVENIKYKFTNNFSYADGKLYFIIEQMAGSDIEDELGGYGSYSSQYKLVSLDVKTGNVANLGNLPKTVLQLEDYSMAAYNGKIYLAGGYNYNLEQVSNQVRIYNPQTKKWIKGPDMPEGRGYGKLLQTGNKLVYTLGYSQSTKVAKEDEKTDCPNNLILSGSTWKVAPGPKLFSPMGTVNKAGALYSFYEGSVGVCKEGIAYAGMPAKNLGDTFIFNVNSNQYKGLSYQLVKDHKSGFFKGAAAGGYFYGIGLDDNTVGVNINTGNVAVKAAKYKGGTIYGANTYVYPGNTVKIKVVPKKGYTLKSFTINGVKQNIKQITKQGKIVRLTSDQKAVAKFIKKSIPKK